jgi:ubiquinone/menaquinone biosynthesis C-methylase UbiE
MLYKPELNIIGIDISIKMIELCLKKNLNVLLCNALKLPFKDNQFDYVFSIAVIHHLETREKRIEAINEMFRIVNTNSLIFIYVWAFEQEKDSKRKFKSRDEYVGYYSRKDKKTYYRYYHLYCKDELLYEIYDSNYKFEICKEFYEYGNWGLIIKKQSVKN